MIAVAAAIQIIYGFTLPIVGDDAMYHLNWLDQFSQLRSKGVDYPRWLTHSYGGFGSPTFYFYPPLPYFLGSFLSGLTANITTLYQIVAFIATAASCWTCYYYLRVLRIGAMPAIAGSLFYAIAPYRFVDLYARNALGEHFSFIFLPLLLASIELIRSSKGFDRKALKSIVIAALGWAGALLVNIPAAVILAITFLAYGIVRLRGHLSRAYFAVLGGAVGALIAALYLIPVFELREHTQMNHIFDIGSQEQKWSFILLEFFQNELTAARILNALTLLLSVACLVACIIAWRKKRAAGEHSEFMPALIAVFSLGVFFQLPGIAALVNEITPINLIKYSWRWNVILTLALAIVVAKVRMPRIGSSIALACVLIATLVVAARFGNEFAIHKPYEVLKAYYHDAPEYVPMYAEKEYYAVTRFAQVNKLAPDVIYNPAQGQIKLTGRSPRKILYTTSVTAPMGVIFHQFYWPQWKLWNGDREIALGYDEYGRAVGQLMPGTYKLEMRLESTAGEATGAWLSLAGVLLLIGGTVYLLITRRKAQPDAEVIQPST